MVVKGSPLRLTCEIAYGGSFFGSLAGKVRQIEVVQLLGYG
jgi:hypothetical protein